MSDLVRITDLPPITGDISTNDVFPFVDVSADITHKIGIGQVKDFVLSGITDYYITGATFNTATDVLSLNNSNNTTINVTIDRYNRNFIPSGETHVVNSNFQSFIYGDVIVEGTLLLEDNSQLVIINGDLLLSGGTVSGSGITYLIELPELNSFVTGGTFNNLTKFIDFSGNAGFVPFSVDLSTLTTDNFYTTGGTYNSITKSLDFSGNSVDSTFSVDVSQLLDDTNTFTTGATLNGNIVEFNRNDISNAYSVDLTPLKFTGNTLSTCIPDLFVSTINSCSPLTLSGSVQQYNSIATGNYSHSEGINTTSSGHYSHTEGYQTTTLSIGSHAEGANTTTSGQYSHSEGGITTAFGGYSHAEGSLTTSVGNYSHSEGLVTTSIGQYSHAEGRQTTASGYYSHSEGFLTKSIGTGSHSEGLSTTASGPYSHTEGNLTTSVGNYGHAEGDSTISNGNSSHSEGEVTTALGRSSHVEGGYTIAIGIRSHAEGYLTRSIGNGSHSEGISTTSSGDYSHAEGRETTASGNYSHSEGRLTTSIGDYSHSEGSVTTSSGTYSHSEGYQTTSSGDYSHTEGRGTKSIGYSSHAEGGFTTASGVYSHAEGNGTTSLGAGSHSEGLGTISYENYQHVSGRYNNTTNLNQYFIIGKGTSNLARSNAFRVDSSGNVYGAGATYNTGADYAEYFESINGESLPYGTVVELVGKKIKVCEDPNKAIGVISSNPTMVGNNDDGTADEWVGKYEKDIWGHYVMEDYTYEVPNGVNQSGETIFKTITEKRPKLNPNFDPNITYVPRSQRPEWNIVGLIGQIKVLKSQQIPDRWIKMEDINEEISLYFIR